MSLANVKKGDTVWVVRQGWRRSDPKKVSEELVTAAGPKYVTAGESHSSQKFHRDTGVLATEFSATAWAYASREAMDAAATHEALVGTARKLLDGLRLSKLTIPKLRRLVELLEHD